jgi:basic amino acid/polyamine antiporter, APA family
MTKLKKELKLIDVFCIAAGAMISSGLFILPGLAYYKSGPAIVVAYLLAGILVLPSMFSKAELSTAMPKAGGTYFFIGRSMGAGFGTLAGISSWFSLAFKSAFALIGIGAFAVLIFPNITILHIKLIATVFCLIFGFINLTSVKHAGRMQVYLVMGLILILIVFLAKGIPEVQNVHFSDFMTSNLRTLFMTAGLIFVSYGGLTKVASIAEEVKNPSKNIPLGMILAFSTVTLLYILVVFVTVGVLGNNLLKPGTPPYSLTPISDAAGAFMGNIGIFITAVAAILAFVSTANAGIMAASRSPMAMSQDRLLPTFFSKVNEKYNTPHYSIIVTTLFMIAVILFLDLELLIKTASTLKILLFAFVNIAVIIMRESGVENYRPKFKSPLYPWIQIFALIAYSFLLIEMGKTPLIISGIFMSGGLFWYWFYGRIRANKEYALLRIVNKVRDRHLDDHALESELKEIIRERDDIKADRFDKIIENCLILDIEKKITKEELFDIVAAQLAGRLNKEKTYLSKKLLEREEDTSTVLTENLAIPHLIIEGEGQFDILPVRCEEGILFSGENPAVQIVFVIAGTKDQRTFHLQSLAAIAQIVQDQNFAKKWLKAKNSERLRDVILLGERRRL